MKNRKLPFGYCLQNGQVREEKQEAETVRLIFRRYGEGASYGKLAEELNTRGIPYAPGRRWDKNMAARVLQDGRYLGSPAYPPIISPELFQSAQAARPDVSGRLECPEVKDVRILARCGQCRAPLRRVRKNQWCCSGCGTSHNSIRDGALVQCVAQLLHTLQERPETIVPPPELETGSETVQAAQESLDRELERAEFDEATAKAQALALASARFDALDSGDYETMRLRYLLRGAEPRDGLDTSLLRQAVSAILVYPSGAVGLTLKNGQAVGHPAK